MNAPQHGQPVTASVIATDLFTWSGGEIVLLAEFVDGRWVVARGWRNGDALTDVRRWTFDAPRPFAGQMRRLSREAGADSVLAVSVGEAALAWATAVVVRDRT